MRLRFRTTNDATTEYAYIDGVALQGVPTHFPVARSPISTSIAGAKVIFLGDSITSNIGTLTMEGRGYLHWTDVVKNRLGIQMLTPGAPLNHPNQSTHGKGGSRAFGVRSYPDPTKTGSFEPYGLDAADREGGGYERLKATYQLDPVTPDFVLITFGMNDHKRVLVGGVPTEVRRVADFKAHIERIVAMVRNQGDIPILVVPHDFYEDVPSNLDSYAFKYNPSLYASDPGGTGLGRYHLFTEVIRDFQDGYGGQAAVDVIDVNAAALEYDEEEMTIDSVHPGEVGHWLYATTIGDYLAERFAP